MILPSFCAAGEFCTLEFLSYCEVHMVLCALLLGHRVVPGAGLASSSFLAVRGTLAEFPDRSFKEEPSATDCAWVKGFAPEFCRFQLDRLRHSMLGVLLQQASVGVRLCASAIPHCEASGCNYLVWEHFEIALTAGSEWETKIASFHEHVHVPQCPGIEPG